MAEGEESQVKGTAESHQALKKAVELRSLVIGKRELYGNREAWTSYQRLAATYRNILITDLEFALDRKVEQDLWNNCFKSQISNLQAAAKEKRNPKLGAEASLTLSWFLEMSSGFYILMLQEVSQTYGIELPFFQSADPYGLWRPETKTAANSSQEEKPPTKTSCIYLCQHCLVHLGDIARYRNQLEQAENFYRHAISLAPSSGQPYNQIAILEASRQNKLATVYFYVRAVSLKCPFPAASTNLAKLLGRLGEGERERSGTRVTAVTFPPLFLRLHGQLLHAVRPRAALTIGKQLCEALTALVVEEKGLTTWQLLQVAAVNMWGWEQSRQGSGDPASLTGEEQLAGGLLASLQAALLLAALMPVYTVQQGRKLLSYHALPVVRLLLEWAVAHPKVLTLKGFTSRPQLWPGLAKLLNEVTPLVSEWKVGSLARYPLPEDWDLQAFSPLANALQHIDMRLVGRLDAPSSETIGLLRCHRLLEVAAKLEAVAGVVKLGDDGTWQGGQVVEGSGGDDLMELVERLEAELLEDIDSSEEEPEWEASPQEEQQTKGILKQADNSPSEPKPRPPPPSRNVAMAAILKHAHMTSPGDDGERRTVMFLTPSPGSSQTSGPGASQDEKVDLEDSWQGGQKGAAGQEVGAAPRERWSPPAKLDPPPLLPPVPVDRLDFSVPPPSLHSNFRPPALAAPALYCPDTDSIGGVPKRPVQGINPLNPSSREVTKPSLPQYQTWSDNDSGSLSYKTDALTEPRGHEQPLIHTLLSSVERPASLGLHQPSSVFAASSSPWTPMTPAPALAPASPPGASYSLFSPSAWPPPSLLSPQASPRAPGPAAPSPLSQAGANQPSPLERLLLQNPDK